MKRGAKVTQELERPITSESGDHTAVAVMERPIELTPTVVPDINNTAVTRIAILGTAPSTRGDVPWGAPMSFWGLNDAHKIPGFGDGCNTWFELHTREWFTSATRPPDHLAWMQSYKGRIFMWETHPDIPGSVRYPFEQVCDTFTGCSALMNVLHQGAQKQINFKKPKGYVTSSIAEMMAVALLEMKEGDEMYMWGVDLAADTEYFKQRSCVEYLGGYAQGKGIKLFVPEACPLFRGAFYGRPGGEGERAEFAQLLESTYYQRVNAKRVIETSLVEAQGGLKLLEELKARYPSR
jgi:hypothetical protein